MELFQYLEGDSWVHSSNALTKILFVIFTSFIVFVVWDLLKLLLIISLLVVVFASIKPPKHVVYPYVKISAFFTFFSVLSQSIFFYGYYYSGSGTVLFYIIPPNFPIVNLITMGKGVAVVLEGFIYGLLVSLKAIGFLVSALILVSTTKPGDMLRAFLRIKIPIKIAVASMIALRFIPLLIEEVIVTSKLIIHKGEKISLRQIHRIFFLILKNVIINAYKRAFAIAIALKLRGLERGILEINTRTSFSLNDLVFFILSAFFLFFVLVKI